MHAAYVCVFVHLYKEKQQQFDDTHVYIKVQHIAAFYCYLRLDQNVLIWFYNL